MSSPYINHFLQPDSLIPDPSNPQAWNRYSYVGNNPTGYNDPMGHMRIDGGTGGNAYTPKPHPKPKPSIKERKTLDDLIHTEIDRRFDPLKGWLPPSVIYEASEYPTDDYYALEAYKQAGVDFLQYASNNQDNPMTEDDWKLNSDVRIDYIYAKGIRNQPPGYFFFLNYMGRDANNPSNYEANYLNALMTTHPQQVEKAKDAYYDQLIFQYGDSQGAWEFLQMSIGVNGPD